MKIPTIKLIDLKKSSQEVDNLQNNLVGDVYDKKLWTNYFEASGKLGKVRGGKIWGGY